VSSTTRQESSEEIGVKKLTWNTIFIDDKDFSCYFVPLQAEGQIFESKCFFFASVLILFTFIYCIKGAPIEF
jgi:hypothetical protein